MRDQYLARAGSGVGPEILKAVKDYLDNTNAAVRWAEKARLDAEPRHLEDLLKLAARAYRRPIPYRGEGHYIQLRCEAYNAFNHTQWSGINTGAIFNSAGVLTNLPIALGGGGGRFGFGAENSVRKCANHSVGREAIL